MNNNQIDLYSLLQQVKKGIYNVFPNMIWVVAEISSIKPSGNGHCYLDLSYSDNGKLLAKCSAIIWASKVGYITAYFKQVSGSNLAVGMKVLLQVNINYNELYGLSLIINDINPNYTIGEQEVKRQQTIQKLQQEGLIGSQKLLSLSFLPYNLAIISAENAAGLRDFLNHLHENEYGFVLKTDLFSAIMQGKDCSPTIIEAINNITQANIRYDAILIIRGGGSTLDLGCFDDYSLACAIAKCPIPVFTAIGHDQDYHVCDMVAYNFVKTPTALADMFLQIYIDHDKAIVNYGNKLKLSIINKISAQEMEVSVLERRFKTAFINKYTILNLAFENLQHKVKTVFNNKIAILNLELNKIEEKINMSNPRELLKRGYILAVNSKGVVIKSVKGAKVGSSMKLIFADGVIESTITKIKN